MLSLRSRLGARMVPAPQLLADIIQNRNVPRAIAMVADQEPVSSERKHWLKFLNRDSAFFLGAEEISRSVRYAAFFARIRRVARGRYEVEFVPLSAAGEQLPPGEFTARYARDGGKSRSGRRRPTGRGRTSAGSSESHCTARDKWGHSSIPSKWGQT